VGQDEGDDAAVFAGARGAARPVEIVLVVGWRVDLQDQRDIIDMDAAGRNVGGDKDRQAAIPEPAEHPVAHLD
jgi:hypothetical protein